MKATIWFLGILTALIVIFALLVSTGCGGDDTNPYPDSGTTSKSDGEPRDNLRSCKLDATKIQALAGFVSDNQDQLFVKTADSCSDVVDPLARIAASLPGHSVEFDATSAGTFSFAIPYAGGKTINITAKRSTFLLGAPYCTPQTAQIKITFPDSWTVN